MYLIVSGGMDSVAMLYKAHKEFDRVSVLSFNYGQRHVRELEFAALHANLLGVPHTIIPMSFLAESLKGSALTDNSVPVPYGHYAAESMKATIVPNRNAIMLSIAVGVALAAGDFEVGTAVHAGDHAIYPDCRPEFIRSFQETMRIANDAPISIWAPFIGITKAQIVTEGEKYHVPWAKTWSCYVGGSIACGKCGTDVERKEAFNDAGVPDPTEYQD